MEKSNGKTKKMAQSLVLPDDELARKVKSIKILSLGIIAAAAVAVVVTIVIWLFEPTYPAVSIIWAAVAVMLISLLTYWLGRIGRVKFAGYFFIIGLTVFSSLVVYSFGGVAGPTAIMYAFPILATGMIIGINSAFFIATLVSILYLVAFWLESAGVFPQAIEGVWQEIVEGSSRELLLLYGGLFIRVMFFYLIAFLSWFAASRLNQALHNVHRYAAELQTANEKLQANEEELRAANEELKEAQEQLIRSERLAAIGQLAGGVGHELRNPLGAIKNAVYYIKGKVAKSELAQKEPRVMEFLDIADDEINSSNKIINDLLGFSRVGKPAVSSTRIKQVIDDALSRVPIPENIELTKRLDTDLNEIEVDPDQIQLVLLNIIMNAVQAMPEGGKLTVSTREEGKFLEVEITDTGGGIPEETLDKIFEPLFTTRAKGIGLGLAVSKSLVDRHGGHIEVKSKVGKGTTFKVKLPLKAA